MRFHLGSTSKKQPIARAIKPVLENLENRRMLAIVEGEQLGFYQNGAGQVVRVTVRGGGALAFVGSSNSSSGGVQLNDIPMTILDPETGAVIRQNLGGIGGRDGAAPIHEVTGRPAPSLMRSNGGGGLNNFYLFNGPVEAIAFEALATNTAGRTYAINRRTEGGGAADDNPAYDVVGVDNNNGRVQVLDSLEGKLLTELQSVNPAFEAGDLGDLIGADFDLANPDIMYIAMVVNYPFGNGTEINRTDTPIFLSYNIRSETVSFINRFGANSSNDSFEINDFTVLDNDRIAFFGTVQSNNGPERTGLFITDKTRPGPDGAPIDIIVGVGDNAEPIEEVAAIEAINSTTIMVVDERSATARLLRVNLTQNGANTVDAGTAIDADQDPDADVRRGAGIADLSYNSRLVDSASFQLGRRGVLLGADVGMDELVALDVRERFANSDVYAIFDAEATVDTSLAMTVITPSSNQNLSFEQRLFQGVANPYNSTAGQMLTGFNDAGEAVLTTLDNGGVFIGGRALDADDARVIPVLSRNTSRDPENGNYVGTLPGIRLPSIVNPGIYISGAIKDVFIAGTITGRVSINYSVDQFYAGNIITGESGNPASTIRSDNFFVGGDLRNLMVRGSIGNLAGADNDFDPQTDFAIAGRVQQIKSGGEFRAAVDVAGKTMNISNRDAVQETEAVVRDAGNNVVSAFNNFRIANQGFNRNDSFDNPQIIGSIADRRGRNDKVTITGTINNGPNFGDFIDTYGLPLLAGEGAVVQLISEGFQDDVELRIFDPEGRLYYTDRSNQNSTRDDRQFQDDMLSYDLPINFTADKPGLWRVTVRATAPNLRADGDRPYTLNISQIGAISLGGLHSNGSIIFNNPTLSVRVRTGDLGAILTGTGNAELYGADLGDVTAGRDSTFDNPIHTQRGNIRVIEAANISHLENGVVSAFPNIVSAGKIGLIHADGRLYINDAAVALNTGTNGRPSRNLITRGDIQTINAGGNFNGILATNGGIGVIRAASIDGIAGVISAPSYFQINADGRGNDELGLIDVTGNFGNGITGGPALSSGNGANIKYIRVGGLIYRDRFFGFGTVIKRTETDTSITVTDDTGAEVSVKPVTGEFIDTTFSTGEDTTTGGGGTDTTDGGDGNDPIGFPTYPDPFGGGNSNDTTTGGGGTDTTNGGTGTDTTTSGASDPFSGGGTGGLGGLPSPFTRNPVITDPSDPDAGVPDELEVDGDITLETLPVRSGGFVITSVTSTTGVTVATNRKGGGGVADISRIVTGTQGAPLVVTTDGNVVARPTVGEEESFFLDVILVGNSRVNVFEIDGGGTAEYTRIDNYTDGEIVNIDARSVGVIVGEWIGVARKSAGVALEGVANVTRSVGNVANLYPFNNAKNMITLEAASTIASRGPIGNITIGDRLQYLIANAGRQNVKGVHEGIVAPILLFTAGDTELTGGGTIDRIDIGEGLAYSGSGETSFGGIYSTDRIGNITNVNGGGDLRGDVIANTYINRIELTGNGSILDADIYAVEVGENADAIFAGVVGDEVGVGFEVALERINVIPNSRVVEDTPANPIGVGKINITGRGGMMNSRVYGYNIGKLTATRGSFGVLTSDFLSETAGTMGGITADGLGIRFVSYRGGSNTGDIIATGTGKLRSTDEFTRSIRGSENSAFDLTTGNSLTSSNDLHRFLGTTKGNPSVANVTNDGVIEDSLIQSNREIRLVKAHTIRVNRNPLEARPRDETYPMQINTGGDLRQVTTIRDINGARIVAGRVGNIDSGNDIRSFQLQTTGAVNRVTAKRNVLGSSNLNLIGSASLNQIQVGGNMGGTAYVARGIRSIIVGGDFSSARTQGGVYTPQSINQVLISGDVTSGSLLQTKGVIKELVIGGDVESGGQVVAKSIQSKRIKGDVDGTVT